MNRHSRQGLTLIELLVVMAIMGILGGIVAVVAPKFAQSSRVAEGSRQLTNWLSLARQRAQRDKAPRGIRFAGTLPTSVSRQQELYSSFVYVEQPEDLAVDVREIDLVPQNQLANRRVAFRTQAFSNLQFGISDPAQKYTATQKTKFQTYRNALDPANTANVNSWLYLLWFANRNLAVAPGSPAASQVIRDGDIVQFGNARYTVVYEPIVDPAGTGSFVILNRPRDEFRYQVPEMTAPLPPARIIRSPRPIAGEAELTLPRDVAVDILWTNKSAGVNYARTLPAPDVNDPPGSQFFDVMFAPSGEVVGGLGGYGRLVFWLRDTSLKDSGGGTLPQGENRLIVVHCRTGQITSHPVAIDPSGNPSDAYQFIRDGKSSANED
ncbi:MAG: prepilin-type N-terminal cleavage/methylation domain-containing protein [Gemmataceae bacterium]|nr:prepilin-type N-terminal cleavage/methylation domain-containing protein [Gemmataceae bacterium]